MSQARQDLHHEDRHKQHETTYVVVPSDEDSTAEKVDKSAGWWKRTMLDTWIPEVAAITFSAACLVGIIGLVWAYEGKPTPQLPMGITLNAMVSILATASRSTLLYVVAAAVGQLKWVWYHSHKRKLQDLQTFDDASRGPWGSINLLVNLRLRSLASLGAMITIVALSFDPFLQQVLHYPVRPAVDFAASPTLQKARVFMEDSGTTDWLNAISAGIWSTPDRFQRQPTCPASTCSWGPYRSVGWCAQCTDMTSQARVVNCSFAGGRPPSDDMLNGTGACNITLGHGLPVSILTPGGNYSLQSPTFDDVQMPDPNLSVRAIWGLGGIDDDEFGQQLSNVTYANVTNPVVALGHVTTRMCDASFGDTVDEGFVNSVSKGLCITTAEECVLTLCETELKTSTSNGSSNTVLVDTDFGLVNLQQDRDIIENGLPFNCWRPSDSSPESLVNVSEPGADLDHHISCPQSLTPIYGLVSEGPENYALYDIDPDTRNYQETLILRLTGNATQEIIRTDLYDDPNYSSPVIEWIATNGLGPTLEGVAASLSALALRSNTTIPVHGEAKSPVPFVAVTWAWLAGPAVLELSSILLLAMAIASSRRSKVKLWKSSLLPLLFYGLEPELLHREDMPRDVSGLVETASGIEVRLKGGFSRGRIILTP